MDNPNRSNGTSFLRVPEAVPSTSLIGADSAGWPHSRVFSIRIARIATPVASSWNTSSRAWYPCAS